MNDVLKVLKEIRSDCDAILQLARMRRTFPGSGSPEPHVLSTEKEVSALDKAIAIMEVVTHQGFRELRYHAMQGDWHVRVFKKGSWFGSDFPTTTEALEWAHRMLFPDKEG